MVWFGVTMTLALIVAVMESLLCRTYCITWPPWPPPISPSHINISIQLGWCGKYYKMGLNSEIVFLDYEMDEYVIKSAVISDQNT